MIGEASPHRLEEEQQIQKGATDAAGRVLLLETRPGIRLFLFQLFTDVDYDDDDTECMKLPSCAAPHTGTLDLHQASWVSPHGRSSLFLTPHSRKTAISILYTPSTLLHLHLCT